PGAPAPLRAHARVNDRHRDRDAAGRERNEDDRLIEDSCRILLLQRVEDRLVPDVELVRKEELSNDQQDQAGGHQPGDFPASWRRPEPARFAPEAPDQRLVLRAFDRRFRHESPCFLVTYASSKEITRQSSESSVRVPCGPSRRGVTCCPAAGEREGREMEFGALAEALAKP